MNPHDHYVTWASGRARVAAERVRRRWTTLLPLALYSLVVALAVWRFVPPSDCNAARTRGCLAAQDASAEELASLSFALQPVRVPTSAIQTP